MSASARTGPCAARRAAARRARPRPRLAALLVAGALGGAAALCSCGGSATGTPSGPTSSVAPPARTAAPSGTPAPPLQPVVAVAVVGGPQLPGGRSGVLDVVAVGPAQNQPDGSASVGVLLRNGTGQLVHDVSITATAGGRAVVTAIADIEPHTAGPGALVIADVGFPRSPPAGLSWSAQATAGPDPFTVDLQVRGASHVGIDITGEVADTATRAATAPIQLLTVCVASGRVLFVDLEGLSDERVAPGGRATFRVQPDSACPAFAIGASGTAG